MFLFFSLLMAATGSVVARPVAESLLGSGNFSWDEAKMEKAEPMPMPPDDDLQETPLAESQAGGVKPHGKPGFAPGWSGNGPKPASPLGVSGEGMASGGEAEDLLDPFFDAPTDPEDPQGYAPFQRWTWYGRYLTYPTSTIGKLFLRQDENADGDLSEFVCSAVVIEENTIATTGHCVHNGRGETANADAANNGWSTDILFCPSYRKGGPDGEGQVNPLRGCWEGEVAVTTPQWEEDRNWDRDYACIVTEVAGGVNGTPVGEETGWVGRAWNWSSRQPIHAWGYPAAAPFPSNGYHIITVTSTEWYEVDMDPSEPQVSKYIGSDMTAGVSGGPWWLNTGHHNENFEYDDTDGSDVTNPGQGEHAMPLLNGLNSHKRISGGQVFTQEIGSPQFLSTVEDEDESEDVFAECFAQGGA